MSIYRIADLNIKIEPKYENTSNRISAYLCNERHFDFDASATQAEINDYYNSNGGQFSTAACESSIILSKICQKVLESYQGFFFHSSCLMLDGQAYVFSAKSGTGKSTHTALWRKHFGSRVTMINDDKPIIRKTNGKFFVYGTPWMGKSNIGNNVSAPIKAVYILRRGSENKAVRIKPGDVFKEILEATVIPTEKAAMSELLALLDEFFSETPLFLLTCNTDDSAVKAAYLAAN